MQILEFLDDVRRPVSIMEISQALNYPQSSTSALARTLVALGYLQFDQDDRSYFPSMRVTLLGNWAHPGTFRDGALLRMMETLNTRTGDAVVLATRNGGFSHYIHVLQATNWARLHLTLGSMLPLLRSGTGYTILSTYSDQEVWKIVSPYYSLQESNGKRSSKRSEDKGGDEISGLYKILGEIRKLGYSYSESTYLPGGATLAMHLNSVDKKPDKPLIIAIAGIAEVMRARKEELIKILREEVARYRDASTDLQVSGHTPGR